MKKFFVMCCWALGATMLTTSCLSESDEVRTTGEKGTVRLAFVADTDFGNTTTRVVDEAAYRNTANYTVQLFKAGSNDPLKEGTPADFADAMELDKGSYSVKAFYDPQGVKTSNYSRKGFYVEGSTSFVVGDENQAVTVTCAPTCAKVTVNFDTAMATYFDDYYVSIQTKALGELTAPWSKTDTDPWYLVVENNETVTATIHLTPKGAYKTQEQDIVKTYTLSPNKAWKLSIAPVYTPSNGSLGIEITIDTTTNGIPVEIVVPSDWV